MIIDGLFEFGMKAITNSNTATVSTNVFDAGSAKKVFSQIGSPPLKVKGLALGVGADDNPTLLVQLLAADDAALTTNPIVLGSTGIIVYGPDGATALTGAAQAVDFQFKINEQKVAKRYYGLMVTLGGTNPDMLVSKAVVVHDSQSNDYRAAAATP